MRVFSDANILFSASTKGSATRHLWDMAQDSAELVANLHAIEEARRNLALKRAGALENFKELLRSVSVTYAFVQDIPVVVPEQDIPILSAAIGAQCSHLWTSDKRHFGKLYGRHWQTFSITCCRAKSCD